MEPFFFVYVTLLVLWAYAELTRTHPPEAT